MTKEQLDLILEIVEQVMIAKGMKTAGYIEVWGSEWDCVQH
jgi:hypothetical protein